MYLYWVVYEITTLSAIGCTLETPSPQNRSSYNANIAHIPEDNIYLDEVFNAKQPKGSSLCFKVKVMD